MNDDPIVLKRWSHAGAVMRLLDDSIQNKRLDEIEWRFVGKNSAEGAQEQTVSDGVPPLIDAGSEIG